jgi:hypothetical protein
MTLDTTELERAITALEDPLARSIFQIMKQNKKYPRDCITDGACEKLARYIGQLERYKREHPET